MTKPKRQNIDRGWLIFPARVKLNEGRACADCGGVFLAGEPVASMSVRVAGAAYCESCWKARGLRPDVSRAWRELTGERKFGVKTKRPASGPKPLTPAQKARRLKRQGVTVRYVDPAELRKDEAA